MKPRTLRRSRDTEQVSPESVRRVAVKHLIAQQTGGRAGGAHSVRWELLDIPEQHELCQIVETEVKDGGFDINNISAKQKARFEQLVGKAVGNPNVFQEERDLAEIARMGALVRRDEMTPRRRLKLEEPGSLTLPKQWVFDYLVDGVLFPGHLSLLLVLMSAFENGEFPLRTQSAVTFEDGVIGVDRRRGRLLPDVPGSQDDDEEFLLDHLHANRFIEFTKHGKGLADPARAEAAQGREAGRMSALPDSRPTPPGIDAGWWHGLCVELDGLAARAEIAAAADPEMAELLALARAPLPPLDRPVIVPRPVLREVLAHAHATAPVEAVGALMLRGDVVVDYEPLANTASVPGRFRVERWSPWLSSGERAIVCHSHPFPALPTPSAADLAGANRHWLNEPYGIVHLESGTIGMFRIDVDRQSFTSSPVQLVDEVPPLPEVVGGVDELAFRDRQTRAMFAPKPKTRRKKPKPKVPAVVPDEKPDEKPRRSPIRFAILPETKTVVTASGKVVEGGWDAYLRLEARCAARRSPRPGPANESRVRDSTGVPVVMAGGKIIEDGWSIVEALEAARVGRH